MKTAFTLLFLVASITLAKASSGPPPFTNGSPLVSGVDGSYQATVRGTNISGIIRFSYSGGNQTATVAGNAYAIFVEGQSYRGNVQAAINTDTIGGVLDTSASVSGNTASGFFNGSIDQDSPYATFSGDGSLTLVNGTTASRDSTSSASSSSNGAALGAADTGGTGSTTSGGTAVSTAETNVDAAGTSGSAAIDTGSASASTEASVSAELTITTEPVVSLTRSFKFSGVRNSQTTR